MRSCTTGPGQLVLPVLVVCAIASCAPSQNPQTTSAEPLTWLKKMIVEIEAQPPTIPRTSIWRYTFRGAPVYYRSAPCCDVFSELFDQKGVLICRPSGGLAGSGDGKCPDFEKDRSDEELIWRDGRAS